MAHSNHSQTWKTSSEFTGLREGVTASLLVRLAWLPIMFLPKLLHPPGRCWVIGPWYFWNHKTNCQRPINRKCGLPACRCAGGCCESWGKPSNVWEEEMPASCPQEYHVWPVLSVRLRRAGAKTVVEASREAEMASRTLAQHFRFFLLNISQSQVIIWNINWCSPVFPTILSTTQADENFAFVSSGKAWHKRKWEQ